MFAGIDTHKDTLAAALTDQAGRLVGHLEVSNTEVGFAELVELFEQHEVVRVGIEGSGNFGGAVAIHLLLVWTPDRSVQVVEVPTLMTSRNARPSLVRARPTRSTRSRSPASPPASRACRRSG